MKQPRVLAITGKPDRSETAFLKIFAQEGILTHVISENPIPEFADIDRNLCGHTTMRLRNRMDFRGMKMIRRLLQETGSNIIHSISARALTCSLLASSGMSVAHVSYRGTIGHLNKWDPMTWLSYLHPRVSKIICVSHAVQDYLSSLRVADEKLTTIYKGHDSSWYGAVTYSEGRDLLTAAGVPRETFAVACVANARPVKGVDILARSMTHIPSDAKIDLVLIGEIRDDRIHKIIQTLPNPQRVHVLGPRPDAPQLVAGCDAFVMPSREREGLPRAVIEAMVQARPVIVTNVGGMPELVLAEQSGLVVPPSDPPAIASAILRLRDDATLRESLGNAARHRIINDFNIAKTVSATRAVYNQVIGN